MAIAQAEMKNEMRPTPASSDLDCLAESNENAVRSIVRKVVFVKFRPAEAAAVELKIDIDSVRTDPSSNDKIHYCRASLSGGASPAEVSAVKPHYLTMAETRAAMDATMEEAALAQDARSAIRRTEYYNDPRGTMGLGFSYMMLNALHIAFTKRDPRTGQFVQGGGETFPMNGLAAAEAKVNHSPTYLKLKEEHDAASRSSYREGDARGAAAAAAERLGGMSGEIKYEVQITDGGAPYVTLYYGN
jgi:hypothetical protein